MCSRIIGYQVGSPGAFHNVIAFLAVPPTSVNDIYVDGVNVTYGSSCTHIWTPAAGMTEETQGLADCSCTAPGQSPPDYVGNNNVNLAIHT